MYSHRLNCKLISEPKNYLHITFTLIELSYLIQTYLTGFKISKVNTRTSKQCGKWLKANV